VVREAAQAGLSGRERERDSSHRAQWERESQARGEVEGGERGGSGRSSVGERERERGSSHRAQWERESQARGEVEGGERGGSGRAQWEREPGER
jgi:hypothetical protein